MSYIVSLSWVYAFALRWFCMVGRRLISTFSLSHMRSLADLSPNIKHFLGFSSWNYDASHINPISSINLRFMQTPTFIPRGLSYPSHCFNRELVLIGRDTNWMLCLDDNTRFSTSLTRIRSLRCKWLLALRHRIVSAFAIALQTTIIKQVSRHLWLLMA